MRTKEFTFKKTKRVKQVEEHAAISIDLTVKEAADLVQYLAGAHTPDCRYQPLLDALRAFIIKYPEVKSDLVRDTRVTPYGFRMVKA